MTRDMPGRPQAHVLGDIAVEAFKRLLPPRWIYRSKPPDYGVDGEVELVSEEGHLTGRLFYAQIKGTEGESLDDTLTVRIKRTTANYFQTLDLPVLIVRYHAPTNRVFAKWFDPIDAALTTGATLSIKFSTEDHYDEIRSKNIPMELEGIRLVKFQRLDPPVSVSLSCAADDIAGFSVTEIISKLKSTASARLLRFVSNGLVVVEIDAETTRVRIGIAYNFSMETALLVGSGALEELAANVVMAIGLCLGRLGQGHAASMLIYSSADRSSLLKSFIWGMEAALYMAKDSRPVEALNIARSALGSPDALQIAQLMAAVPMLTGSESAQGIQTELLRKIVAETERQSDRLQCATAHYNLGNHLASIRARREAVRHYHLAVRADQQYASRSYFWRELGGLFFACHRFRASIKCYERAEEKGDEICKPLLADALLWAGLYGRAIEKFDDYVKSAKNPRSEWVLKLMLAQILCEKFGLNTQQRCKTTGLRRADPNGGDFGEVQFLDAIQADGLCGLAWFNMAACDVRSKNYENASIFFMAAALCQPNDLQAWCSAIGSAIMCQRADLLGHLIAAGYRTGGERFAEALIEYIKQQPAGFPKEKVLETLGEFLAVIPPVEKPKILRILGGSASATKS